MTDKEIGNILADMVVIVDTREQKNQHILNYLDSIKVKYLMSKLDSADYSFILPHYPELNLDRKFIIEKKNSLDEIAGNFTKGRERFNNEFARIPEGTTTHLVIEEATWKKLLKGSYRSKFPAKSMMASLLTFSIRYKFNVWFVGKSESPELIYNLLHYELFSKLKEMREM